MKIKKLLLGFAVCLMIVPIALGLSACGKKDNGGNIAVTGVSISGANVVTVGVASIYTATVTPNNATDKSVTWSVTGSATISNSGQLTASATGAITIKATSVSTNTISGTKTILVEAAGTVGLVYSPVEGGGYAVSSGSVTSGSVVIPSYYSGEPIISIANNAFTGLADITEMFVPSTITHIGTNAFTGCTNLSITQYAGTDNSTTKNLFGGLLKKVIVAVDMSYVGGYEGVTSIEEVEIMATVTQIPANAFKNTNIETVTFASGSQLKTIGFSAFYNTKLTSITIPASVETIGNAAFSSSYAYQTTSILATVTFANGSNLKEIEGYAFAGAGISTITIPASVETIGQLAFHGCGLLTTVTFANGSNLKEIGFHAFTGSGITSITIPASVEIIDEAFAVCASLQTVVFAGRQNITFVPNNNSGGRTLPFIYCPALTSITVQFANYAEMIAAWGSDWLAPYDAEWLGLNQSIFHFNG